MHFMPLIESEAIFVTWPFAQLVRRFKADGETAAGADHAREFRHRRRRVAPKVDVVDAARLVHGCVGQRQGFGGCPMKMQAAMAAKAPAGALHHRRSEEHTSELQSLMRISYAVF